MSDTVIRVDNLGKKYILGHQQTGKYRYKSLRDTIANGAKSISSRFLKPGKGNISNPAREEFWALNDVSFDIKQGDRVGIIGRNGAGKSTLLKILSRITEPTNGRISIKGRVASLLEVGTGFHPELTGRENIYLNGAILGMTKEEIKRKFDEIVAFAEVEKFLDTPVKRYSSGMYVRLAFAVAAHLEPEILVVDEVLAVGDAAFQKKCLGKMSDVSVKEGRTVLFVSHNMTALKSLCDRALLLKSGHLLATGEVHQVVSSYLESQTDSLLLEKEWDSIELAPGNENVRFKSVKLIPDTDNAENPITTKTSMRIECQFWNLLYPLCLNLSLHLYNLERDCIFATPSKGVKLTKGLHTKVCHIPGNLLNDGIYTISIMLVQDESICLYNLENALTFEVQDERETTAWHGKWPGVVRPILNWELKN